MLLKNSVGFPVVVSLLLSLLLSLVGGSPLSAAIVDSMVRGNELSARVVLPGITDLEIIVSFEQVDGLSLESLGLSAALILPLDPAFQSRLPAGVSALTVLPVQLSLDPPESGGLSFRGLPTVSIHTDLLSYEPGTSYRLFAAQPGEPFRDVSAWTSSGSYRVGGSEPKFAGEYVLLSDVRLVDEVILDKLIWLEATLAANEGLIGDPVAADLSGQLAAVRQAIEEGSRADAIGQLDAFTATVREQSGCAIPDQWRAERDLVNVAGALRAVAATLRYSLEPAN